MRPSKIQLFFTGIAQTRNKSFSKTAEEPPLMLAGFDGALANLMQRCAQIVVN
jgi:hypothetical protein